jgi:glycosyltransferase involved in cell wall biosynthesis
MPLQRRPIAGLDDPIPVPVPVSVIIPAHNEELVIGHCLRALSEGAGPGELEIVVVCNGCSDQTAAVVAAACPDATVIELAVPSKSAALNAGDAAATVFPRFYVDADIEMPLAVLRAIARVMVDEQIPCVAPFPRFQLAGRPWAIRRFYEIWQQLPYLNDDVVGNGVYALTERGRERFVDFPDITADDQFVLQQFDRTERSAVRGQYMTIFPPTNLRELVQVRTRAYRGSNELERSEHARYQAVGGAGRALLDLARRPSNIPGVAVYIGVSLTAKFKALVSRARWERDSGSRLARG